MNFLSTEYNCQNMVDPNAKYFLGDVVISLPLRSLPEDVYCFANPRFQYGYTLPLHNDYKVIGNEAW